MQELSQDIQQPIQQHSIQIASIKVHSPEQDTAKGYYTYLISGEDKNGTFQIRRRFNDFFYFREALVRKWPAIYVPPVPQKKLTGNKDIQNVQYRKKLFDIFLKKISKIKHLFNSPITTQFLRNKGLDMEKFYTTLTTPKYQDLIKDYKIAYKKQEIQNNKVFQKKANMNEFGNFVKKAQKQLQKLKDQIHMIVQARTSFVQNLNTCNNQMLPDYQKNIYLQYLPQQNKSNPKLIFYNNNKVNECIKQLKQISSINSFSVCLDTLTYEYLQTKAMSQTLQVKDHHQNLLKQKQQNLLTMQSQLAKLNSGKTTLRSIFSKGSKNQQVSILEKVIPQQQKQIQALRQFNSLTTIIFADMQIPTFKKDKQFQYYKMMHSVSQNQLKYLSEYGNFMKSIMEGLLS